MSNEAKLSDHSLATPSGGESAPQGWRPIETAPRDGTFFLAARFVKGCRHARYGYAMVDRWHGSDIRKTDRYEGLGHFNRQYWPATHWLPLPPPPETKS